MSKVLVQASLKSIPTYQKTVVVPVVLYSFIVLYTLHFSRCFHHANHPDPPWRRVFQTDRKVHISIGIDSQDAAGQNKATWHAVVKSREGTLRVTPWFLDPGDICWWFDDEVDEGPALKIINSNSMWMDEMILRWPCDNSQTMTWGQLWGKDPRNVHRRRLEVHMSWDMSWDPLQSILNLRVIMGDSSWLQNLQRIWACYFRWLQCGEVALQQLTICTFAYSLNSHDHLISWYSYHVSVLMQMHFQFFFCLGCSWYWSVADAAETEGYATPQLGARWLVHLPCWFLKASVCDAHAAGQGPLCGRWLHHPQGLQ